MAAPRPMTTPLSTTSGTSPKVACTATFTASSAAQMPHSNISLSGPLYNFLSRVTLSWSAASAAPTSLYQTSARFPTPSPLPRHPPSALAILPTLTRTPRLETDKERSRSLPDASSNLSMEIQMLVCLVASLARTCSPALLSAARAAATTI